MSGSVQTTRLKIAVRGAVQGVGFRPFVHRLAAGLRLAGWVNNSSQGVFIEAEGPRPSLEQFLARLQTEKPPRSFIQSLECWWLDATGCAGFEIRPSEAGGDKTAVAPQLRLIAAEARRRRSEAGASRPASEDAGLGDDTKKGDA